MKRVCPGWFGVHSEERVLAEGSAPVSHGMCRECEDHLDREEAMSGAPPETAPTRKHASRKGIFMLDCETISQERFTTPYEPDDYWLKEQWKLWQAKGEGDEWPPEAEDEHRPDYPCKESGNIPSTHPATGHIVSVATAFDDPRQKEDQYQSQIISLDTYLHTIKGGTTEGKAVERAPRLDSEITQEQLRRAERSVIKLAFEQLSWAYEKGLTIVTFNGKGFDLPFMRWRAAMLGLTIPRLNWYELLYPYRHKEHIDLRLLFSDGDRRAKGTLAMWCRAFGLEAEESGSHVFEWVMAGRWEELTRYGHEEMVSLRDLFRAVEPVL